jgi:hypothetical protein
VNILLVNVNTLIKLNLWKTMISYSPCNVMDNGTLLWWRGLNMEGQTWHVTFRWNCVKLVWAFINIMNVVHHFGILHNDLSKDNIMLHFSLDKLNDEYITICNWGEVECLQKVTLLQKHGFYVISIMFKILYNQYLKYISSLKWLNVSIMTKIKSSNVHYD